MNRHVDEDVHVKAQLRTSNMVDESNPIDLCPHIDARKMSSKQKRSKGKMCSDSDEDYCRLVIVDDEEELLKRKAPIIGPMIPNSRVVAAPTKCDDAANGEHHLKESGNAPRGLTKEAGAELIIGPALPAGFIGCSGVESDEDTKEEELFGPFPPKSLSSSSRTDNSSSLSSSDNDMEGSVIGPLPFATDPDRAADEYAKRRIAFETKGDDEIKLKREDWMLKVPKKVAAFGLGARSFKRGSSASAEVDVTWEDAPQSKRRCSSVNGFPKVIVPEQNHVRYKMAEIEEEEPLVESHMRAMRNADEKEVSCRAERKPFNREEDMAGGAGKVSLAELKNHMGSLKNRFSSGVKRHFL